MKYGCSVVLLALCFASTNAQDDTEPRPIECYETFNGTSYGFRHCRKDLPLRVHIHYNITDADPEPETNASIVMLVQVKHEGWVSFGFGLDGSMIGSNTVLGWASSGDPENMKIGDYHLYDYHETQVIEENNQNLTFAEIEYVDGHTKLFFKRKLDAEMAMSLHVDDFAYIVYAMGKLPTNTDDLPLYHGRGQRATYKYNFRDGKIQLILDHEVVAHAVCMLLAFGFLIPGAIAIARYRKGMGPSWLQNRWIKAYWFQIHIGMNVLGTIISFVAFMFGVFWIGTHFYKAHMVIGIMTMTLCIIQPINGWSRPHKLSPHTTFYGQPTRYIWEKYHLYVGRFFPLLGWINMIIGVTITEWTNLLILILFLPFAFCMLYFAMSIKFINSEAVEPIILDDKKNQASERTPLDRGNGRGIGYRGAPSPLYDARRPTV